MGTIALPYVLGGCGKEISSEEFPFENINNQTSCKGLKLFKGHFDEKKEIDPLYFPEPLQVCLAWKGKYKITRKFPSF